MRNIAQKTLSRTGEDRDPIYALERLKGGSPGSETRPPIDAVDPGDGSGRFDFARGEMRKDVDEEEGELIEFVEGGLVEAEEVERERSGRETRRVRKPSELGVGTEDVDSFGGEFEVAELDCPNLMEGEVREEPRSSTDGDVSLESELRERW